MMHQDINHIYEIPVVRIDGKRGNIHPLYRYLTDKATDPQFSGAITWNFNKFVVGRDGHVVARFGSRTKPDDHDLVAAVEQALNAAP
jgi:glutathione peroxidase